MGYVGKKPADIIATAVDTTTGTFSGDLTVDTNTLYVDSANNRVGVGTVSPSDLLELSGSTAQPAIRLNDTDVSGLYHRIFTPTNTGLAISADTGNVASDSFLRFDVDGSEAMRIDSNGNVGIGVVPETWTTSLSTRALQVGDVTSIHEVASEYSRFASNMYYDGTFKYITSNPATRYTQQGGTHVWDYASSGSADGAITFNEAMRIDSSGNLLVGKTSSGIATAGIELRSNDDVLITSNGSQALYLNRLSSDGSIVEFRQAGTTKGSIGVNTKLYIGGSGETHTTGVSFQGSGTSTNRNISPSDGSGSLVDGAINLGSSSSRWNSLWLSGGVYLGGTGSANYLDDYEEGTWIATITTDGTDFTTSGRGTDGYYTKIGNKVVAYFSASINSPSSGTGNLIITGLPFTANNISYVTSMIGWGRVDLASSYVPYGDVVDNTTTLRFLYSVNNANPSRVLASDLNGNITPYITGSITYRTNS
jgi:hypothetical protein